MHTNFFRYTHKFMIYNTYENNTTYINEYMKNN